MTKPHLITRVQKSCSKQLWHKIMVLKCAYAQERANSTIIRSFNIFTNISRSVEYLYLQEFQQEVKSYQPALTEVTGSEEGLFSTDLATIQSCEAEVIRQTVIHRRSSTPRAFSLASPVPLPHSQVGCYKRKFSHTNTYNTYFNKGTGTCICIYRMEPFHIRHIGDKVFCALWRGCTLF